MKKEEIKKEASTAPCKRPERVTYGINGLMEAVIELPTGSFLYPFMRIGFEGGQLTSYGVTPAKYTTEDSFIQKLIEESEWFEMGKIQKIKSEPLKTSKDEN